MGTYFQTKILYIIPAEEGHESEGVQGGAPVEYTMTEEEKKQYENHTVLDGEPVVKKNTEKMKIRFEIIDLRRKKAIE